MRRPGLGPWKLVRNPGAFPPAWVARSVRVAPNWGWLYSELSAADSRDVAWFLAEDNALSLPKPTAQVASVRSYDGQIAVVDHDGSCILVLRQTYYPGWVYRVNDGPLTPVLKVDGGLQGIPLLGSGTSRVVVRYQPSGLARATKVALIALAAAACVLAAAGLKTLKRSRPPR